MLKYGDKNDGKKKYCRKASNIKMELNLLFVCMKLKKLANWKYKEGLYNEPNGFNLVIFIKYIRNIKRLMKNLISHKPFVFNLINPSISYRWIYVFTIKK